MKKISRIKPQSATYKNSFPDVINYLNRSMHSNSCLETEKLYQETYQIKKLIKHLKKQLDRITKENTKKEVDKLMKTKQFREMFKKKGSDLKNWNWQSREKMQKEAQSSSCNCF